LAELWWRGRLSALSAAIPFTIGINLFLVTRFIYPGWIAPGLVSMAFWIGIIAWFFYLARSIRELPNLLMPREVSQEPDLFPQAREAFLRGNWTKAEKLLTEVLSIEPRDPPALLLMTSIYRHTDRLESAEILLEQISRLEVSDQWALEITIEAKRLKAAIEASHQEFTDELEPQPGPESEQDGSVEAADLTANRRPAA
jgi:hypothetical protein